MSNFVPMKLIISLLLFTSIIGIGVFIQVKLSRSKNKYLGLIMPVICFLLSILIILNMVAFTVFTSNTTTEIITIDGIEEELEESVEITENLGKDVITLDIAVSMFFIFLVANIPTAILGGIYLSERNKIDVKRSIEKMKIEDL